MTRVLKPESKVLRITSDLAHKSQIIRWSFRLLCRAGSNRIPGTLDDTPGMLCADRRAFGRASTVAHRSRQRQPTSITSSRGLGIRWIGATISCSRTASATARNATASGLRSSGRVGGTERAIWDSDYKRTGAARCYRRTGVLEPRNSAGLLADRRSRRVDLGACRRKWCRSRQRGGT